MKNQFSFMLNEVFIPNILFRLKPSFKPKSGKVAINTTIEVDYSYTGNELSVRLKVELPDADNTPFAFAVEGVGNFMFQTEPPEELIENIAKVNCAAIIFPYLRETIADITRRAGVPTLHLQPVNFVAMMKAAHTVAETATAPKKIVTKKKKLTKP